jgi:hypothetical protein
MCDKSPLNQYFFEKYILFKHILFDQFYDLVREKHPGYTDHSHKHIKGILKKANDLCSHRIDPNNDNHSDFLNIYEVYLLLMSIIFHDVAMIIEKREGHAEIQDILKLFDNVILLEEEKEWIRKIVKCHTSSADINIEIPFDEKLVSADYKIHPRFIAAMLRLADELDESKARANIIGLETGSIPKNQIIFHEISKAFDGISPSTISQSINIELSVRKSQLFRKYKKLQKTGQVIFVDEILDRIEKINNERKYCMSFTKYYIEYSSIELKLFIWNDKKDKLLKTIEYTFDDNKGVSAFVNDKFREIRRYKI